MFIGFPQQYIPFENGYGKTKFRIDKSGNIYIIADETDSNLFVLKP